MVIDHNTELFELAKNMFDDITVVESRRTRGASGTRNAGAELAQTDLVAFLDDDAAAHFTWLETLLAPFENSAVVATGGAVIPSWATGAPRWFPAEFGWVIGVSYIGMPTSAKAVRNVWSENMAVRRAEFQSVGGFREGFGKLQSSSRPEDTDLCIRLLAAQANSHLMYLPDSVVEHHVPVERASIAFFAQRCFSEGAGKVQLTRLLGHAADLSTEKAYIRRTIPLALLKRVWRACGGDWRALLQAGAIVLGLVASGLGASYALIKGRFFRSKERIQ